MACNSFSNVKEDLIKSNLVNADLKAPKSNFESLDKYVGKITALAKSKYKVDMGRLFRITEVGNNSGDIYLKNDKVSLSLIPNMTAFQAIDNSRGMELAQLQNTTNDRSIQDNGNIEESVFKLNHALQTGIDERGLIKPKNLPALKIEC